MTPPLPPPPPLNQVANTPHNSDDSGLPKRLHFKVMETNGTILMLHIAKSKTPKDLKERLKSKNKEVENYKLMVSGVDLFDKKKINQTLEKLQITKRPIGLLIPSELKSTKEKEEKKEKEEEEEEKKEKKAQEEEKKNKPIFRDMNNSHFGNKTLKRAKLSGEIDVLVRTLVGTTLCVYAFPTQTIEEIKKSIQVIDGVPPDQQRIIYKGRQLEDDYTLKDYNFTEGETMHLVLRLRGGMMHETSGRTDLTKNTIRSYRVRDDPVKGMSKEDLIKELEEMRRFIKRLQIMNP